MELKQAEINKIARRIARLNKILWLAVCEVEEVVQDPVIREYLINKGYDNPELLKKVADAYEKTKKEYDGFIKMSMNDAYFQDFDNLISNLQEFGDLAED